MHTFLVDLVKRGVLSLVDEIPCCENDRFYHYYYCPSSPFVSFSSVCMSLIYSSLQFFLSPCVFVAFLQLYPFCFLSFPPRLIVKAEEDTAWFTFSESRDIQRLHVTNSFPKVRNPSYTASDTRSDTTFKSCYL